METQTLICDSNSPFHGYINDASRHSNDANAEINQMQAVKVLDKNQCGACLKQFSSEREHTEHVLLHLKQKTEFWCSYCKLYFDNSNHMDLHFKTHFDVDTMQCKICDLVLSNKSEMKFHISKHKKVIKRKTYDKVCTDSPFSDVHKSKHTGKRRYKCKICPSSYTTSGNLKLHNMKHKGERPFVCEECGNTFARSSNLKLHKRQHTGEKPYQCEICSARFTQRSSYKLHLMNHTGERPFMCELCGATFRINRDLNKHLPRHKPKLDKNNSSTS